jgi:hypothetical protein
LKNCLFEIRVYSGRPENGHGYPGSQEALS